MPDDPIPGANIAPVSADIAAALQTREAQLEVVLDNISDVVYLIDVLPDGGYRFVAVNAPFLAATGLQSAQVVGRRLEDVIPEPSLDLVRAHYAKAIADREPVYWEEETHYPAGNKVGEVMIAPVFDANGRCHQLVGTVHDVTERRAHEEQLHHLAHFDALTGLPNRRHIYASLQKEAAAAEAHGGTVALLYMDLDRFKHVNDTHGHPMGDELLRQAADRLLRCTRGHDLVGRFGGDEFGLLAKISEDSGDAAALARQVIEAMQPPFVLEGEEVIATASVGIAVCPDDSCDADTLMRYADTAMYHAKAAGRNAYRFYTRRMNELERERRELEGALRRAVERDEFVLHYQPQVDLATGRWTGAEALLRWQCPEQGLRSPADFVPVLEQTGLIVPVGRWVIAEACRQLAAWRDAGIDGLTVSVNISARQVPPDHRREHALGSRAHTHKGDDGLCEFVVDCFKEYAITPGSLEFELTETTLMSDAENAISLLGDLKQLGVRIHVDDFGTGYSSLAYLKRFPIDALKIDQAFVRGLADDEGDRTIARAIIGLAHSLGLRVIAEGVEEVGQCDFLKAERCNHAQGFYFSRAIPAGEFASLHAKACVGEAP
jgi:diguanylate cyclase (GGDEF)-like protein/PAS domain S-box-containing protein